MDTNEARRILDTFYQLPEYPFLRANSECIGVQVEQRGDSPCVVVLVKLGAGLTIAATGVPSNFKLRDGSDIQVELREAELPRATASETPAVRAGMAARGADLHGYGTLGWSFILNGQPTCMSNWHVFCGLGNDTKFGRSIFVEGRDVAMLSAFQAINPSGENAWDFALGTYRPGVNVLPEFTPCDDGKHQPYATGIARKVALGETSYSVGARSPTCSKGRLVGYGERSVNYDFGVVRFRDQLVFSKMVDPGDSGSIAVRESDNLAMALLFAGSSSESIANPLQSLPWRQEGLLHRQDGSIWPMFVSADDVSSDERGHASFEALEGLSRGLPNFSAGLLFLGVAVRAWEMVYTGSSDGQAGATADKGWPTPVPPPIRNIPVQLVWLSGNGKRPSPNGMPRMVYHSCLCFG